MRVAIDARPLGSGDSVRGIGVYTRELLGAFKKLGYVDTKRDKDISVLENGYSKTSEKFDLVHFTSFNPFTVSVPFTKPQGTRFILTVYDLIQLLYPTHYRPGIRGGVKLAMNKYLIKRNVDAILTITETSKKDICRFFGVDPKVVHVVYLAPRSVFKPVSNVKILKEVADKYELPKTFVLYTGDVNYNKNIPVLVDACRMANAPLVLAGKQAISIETMDLEHPELTHLKGLDWSNVLRLGFVPDEELVAIYNLATLYIQPSLYEGFGLPVLEAMACGTPVVAAKTQALVEIAEDAALFADPKSAADFADKMKLVINGKKVAGDLVRKGLAKVKEFSWEKTAKQTLEIYNGTCKKP